MARGARGFARGKVRVVLDLYKSGLPPSEIALRVYGSDGRRFRQRVHSIINLYGKRLGMLKDRRVHTAEGVVAESDSGLDLGSEVRPGFHDHRRPATPSDPFLGSYRNIVQLKASLRKGEARAVNVMSVVDRLLGPLNFSHEGLVRQTAMLLARRLAGGGRVKDIASVSAMVSLLINRPLDRGSLMGLLDVFLAEGVTSVDVELFRRALAIING